MPNFDSVCFKPTLCEAFTTKSKGPNLWSDTRAAEREAYNSQNRNRLRREAEETKFAELQREEEDRRLVAEIRKKQQFHAKPRPHSQQLN
jgi:hypothetical protein